MGRCCGAFIPAQEDEQYSASQLRQRYQSHDDGLSAAQIRARHGIVAEAWPTAGGDGKSAKQTASSRAAGPVDVSVASLFASSAPSGGDGGEFASKAASSDAAAAPAAPPTTHPGVFCPSCGAAFRGPTHANAPKCVVRCGHNVCGDCLDAAMTQETPLCPVCLNPVDNDVSLNMGLAAFSDSCFWAASGAAAAAASPAAKATGPAPCSLCVADDPEDDTPGTYRCDGCSGLALCKSHADLHAKRMKRTAPDEEHTPTLVMSALSGADRVTAPCPLHPACDLSFFCMRHAALACRDCVVLEHPLTDKEGHEVLALDAAAAQVTAMMQGRGLPKVAARLAEMKEDALLLAAARIDVQQRVAQLETAVSSAADLVRSRIDELEKLAKAKLTELSTARLKTFSASESALAVSVGQWDAVHAALTTAMATGNSLGILQAVQAVRLAERLPFKPDEALLKPMEGSIGYGMLVVQSLSLLLPGILKQVPFAWCDAFRQPWRGVVPRCCGCEGACTIVAWQCR